VSEERRREYHTRQVHGLWVSVIPPPQLGLGQSPGRKQIWRVLRLRESRWRNNFIQILSAVLRIKNMPILCIFYAFRVGSYSCYAVRQVLQRTVYIVL